MKSKIFFIASLLLLWSCGNSSEGKKGAHSNPAEISKENIPNSESDEGLDSYHDEDEWGFDMGDLTKSLNLTVNVPYSEIEPANLDTLKVLLKEYPRLETEGGLKMENDHVAVNFIQLKETLEKFDKVSLERFAFLGENNSGNVKPNPYQGTFIEHDLYGTEGKSGKNRRLYKEVATMPEAEAEQKLMAFYAVNQEELNHIKNLPVMPSLTAEISAREQAEYKFPSEIVVASQKSDASIRFKDIVKREQNYAKRQSELFVKNSDRAREAFYKLNPGWYGEGETSGNTYMDSRKKYIYLPFGELSFADKVIHHEVGNPPGSNANGALGEPDMPHMRDFDANPLICNIGIKGVLTLEFTNNALANVNGPDLYVFEMGALEPTNLEISKDGISWIEVGKIRGGTAQVDIEPYVEEGETFNFIRLTDLNSPSSLPGADVDAVAAIGGAIRLNIDSSVLFDSGKFNLKEGAEAELLKLVTQLKEFGKGTINVEGHTDSDGSDQSNLTLSENRAKTVATFLKSKLDVVYSFHTKGLGERQPIAPNDTEENKQKNRRVEILVIPQQQ